MYRLSVPKPFSIVTITMIGLIFASMSFVQSHPASASTHRSVRVLLYSDKDFKGAKTTYILRHHCINTNGGLNDNYSSVNPGDHCIKVCEHSFCRGRCVQLDAAVADLNSFGFNDMISSISTCH